MCKCGSSESNQFLEGWIGAGFNQEPVWAKILGSFRSVQGKSDPAIAKKYQEICCKFSTKLGDNVNKVPVLLFSLGTQRNDLFSMLFLGAGGGGGACDF